MTETDVLTRKVTLEGEWYKHYWGDLSVMMGDRRIMLTCARLGGYRYRDDSTGKYVKVTRRNHARFESEAQLHYKPLPEKTDFLRLVWYMLSTLDIRDIVMCLLSTAAVTAAGYLYPMISDLVFNKILPAYKSKLLPIVMVVFLGVILLVILSSVVKNTMLSGIRLKMATLTEAAVTGRSMVLSAGFFRANSPGSVAEWLENVRKLCESVSTLIFGTWFTSLLSVMYVFQIHAYSPSMTLPSVVVVLCCFGVSVAAAVVRMRWTRKQMVANAELNVLTFQILEGIEKIKLANAQQEASKRWFEKYDQASRLTYESPLFVRLSSSLPLLVTTLGNLLILAAARRSGLTTGQYMAFYSAYCMLLGAAMTAAGASDILATIKPQFDMIRPILAEPTECRAEGEDHGPASDIEIRDLYFGYTSENAVLKGLNLKIPAGDYVAVVGGTGCGKSTLIRLLLGFEKPVSGEIRYNGADMYRQNLMRLRKGIGVVLQSDRLLPGSILDNMLMADPDVSEEDIWAALRVAGLEDDVRAFPMGLHTIIGERSTLSGGQTQRLHIARAILGKPNILIMDEATSALDNETQASIARALDEMNCTRIVVAHRLSTIRNCRRIIVLDGGKIAEDGTYDELIENRGKFFNLVYRQQVEGNV